MRIFAIKSFCSGWAFTVLSLFVAAPGNECRGQVAPFQHQVLIEGLSFPMSAAFLPDGRMLVITKAGTVYISSPLDQQPVTLSQYLWLWNVDGNAEHGLTEIILDPDFETNHWFYLYYSTLSFKDRVSRFTHVGASAAVNSEVVIWETPVTYSGCCHIGGAMCIDNDNKIMLAIGDDFNAAIAQDLHSPFGKVHRFGLNGAIPSDNPYYDNTPGLYNANGVLKSVYSAGLRSPFRGSYDPPTDRFLISVVGGNDVDSSWEDLRLAGPGENYGWPYCGDIGRGANGDCDSSIYNDPVFTYRHLGSNASIIAGPVYRGSMFGAAWQGKFFYADYSRGWIRYLTFDGNGAVVGDDPFMHPAQVGGDSAISVVKIMEAPDGSLYYISFFGGPDFTGSIHRVFLAIDQSPICGVVTASPDSGPGPTLNVQLSATATDPEGLPLTYQWTPGNGTTPPPGPIANVLYAAEGPYSAQVVVSDGNSSTVCPAVPIRVGTPPTVQITSPLNGSFFQAGTVVECVALGNDDDPLPQSSYSWNAVFHHEQHIHPDANASGTSNFDLIIPADGHGFSGNTYLTVTVTVTDASGLQATASIDLFPQKVNVLLNTEPPGLQLLMEGMPVNTPFVTDQAVGSDLTMSIPLGDQCSAFGAYTFSSWSDGGPTTHAYTVPSGNDTLTAHFDFNSSCGTCGKAMQFDGAGDLVSISTPFTVVGDFTYEFWLNAAPGLTQADAVIGNNTDFSIDLKNNRIRFFKVADRLTGSQNIVPNEWHHYAITRAGGQLKLFVDGVQDMAASSSTFTGTMWVHSLGDALNPGELNGALDEVRIWDHPRTGSQLSQYKDLRIDPQTPGLAAYWAFDQGPGEQVVTDLTANAHHGVRGASAAVGADDPQPLATLGVLQYACPRWGSLALRAMLQGPYDLGSGLMDDDLRLAGLVPTSEPYTALGFERAGSSGEIAQSGVLGIAGPDAIVDWVLVELRSALDPSVIKHTLAAFIQRDGDIVGADGSWPLQIPVTEPSCYVALRHRNHFGAMTSTPVLFDSDPVAIDLTATSQVCFGTNARVSAGGVLLLWAGNTILDPDLKYVGSMNDRDPILFAIGGIVPTSVSTGYSMNDTNLDGLIKYTGNSNDRDIILWNIGGTVPTAVRHEQLP